MSGPNNQGLIEYCEIGASFCRTFNIRVLRYGIYLALLGRMPSSAAGAVSNESPVLVATLVAGMNEAMVAAVASGLLFLDGYRPAVTAGV